MKTFLFMILLFSFTGAYSATCDLDNQTCPMGEVCPIRWDMGPYQCVLHFTQTGASKLSYEEARIFAQQAAISRCRDRNDGHDFASRRSVFSEKIETRMTGTWYEIYEDFFVSQAEFQCR